MPPAVSIVLPIHNQASHIGAVVTGYVEMLDRLGYRYEVILVPNNCGDDSVRICLELAARHPLVGVVEVTAGGWGRAVLAGVEAAGGERICYTNSARTSTEILALILSYSQAYPDVVVKANRKIRDSWQRRLGSLLYNLECRALFDLPVWDINGTPKVFPRRMTGLLELRRTDDLIDAEFAAQCRELGYPIIEVPVLSTTRHGGDSTTNFRSARRMYVGALALKWSRASRSG